MDFLKGWRTIALGVLVALGGIIAMFDVDGFKELLGPYAGPALTVIGALIVFLRFVTTTSVGQKGFATVRSCIAMALIPAVLLLGGALWVSCAAGAVGKAQQAEIMAFHGVKAWLDFEHDNQALCERAIPGSHAAAEKMRAQMQKIVPEILADIDLLQSAIKAGDKGMEEAAKLSLAGHQAQLDALNQEASRNLTTVGGGL